MKIAIGAMDEKIESNVAEQAGRAPFYLIFDETGDLVETLKNPFSRGGGGAGPGVAKMLADKSVETVVIGKCGEKMIDALNGRNITFIEKEGIVQDVMQDIISSK